MDKIELRIDKDQADLIIYALGCARKVHGPLYSGRPLAKLQQWIRARRERRWGDEYADDIAEIAKANGVH